MAIGDLVNKDTDRDGILDWEEPLWGLDPTKTETTPGVPDSSVIKKLKVEQGFSSNTTEGGQDYTENLTETDKFSRELFSTIASLNQNGVMDQTTIDKISSSLNERIKNNIQRKVFTVSDIKIIKDDSVNAIKKYYDTLNGIQKKYVGKNTVADILQRFIIDENNVDTSVLIELDPIIKQTSTMINEILKVSIPNSLSMLHLNFLNSGQGLLENISDMQFFDTDPVIAMGAMSKYEENLNSFQTALVSLINTIDQKLKI
ncbi:hypothetical protein A2356_02205 [Candidatus Nomurabacteria bacterium RIFOXYB1_FULL_39_16]|uniref:Uncharacterized protein n=2 Tax=Candidatus Nomuraibacteriota TaxID=1752729 RepID=A0A0G0QRW3_9BACT|nr:MAG: hypothetical protein UT78_C0007G0012 [Candidatus Nomurabacteria bacterium GW2011_GWF2_40_12]OGJ09972.1 MAG: hypothetical protein A2356_02205 [Candidatus Nomurabacteria bacterium RIFOXYB1_FULL_39_16]OGJ14139.1 MAG: hypothetical protein A2585_02060 [Candidatus Nomurabacteria bacterium RIFOXYD1_FULL_39_12]